MSPTPIIDAEQKSRASGSLRPDAPRILFLNNIAFILDSIVPELRSLGLSARVIGRAAADPRAARKSFSLQTGLNLRDLLLAGKVDILHINYALFGPLGFSKPRVPVVLHCHGSDVRRSKLFKGRISNALSAASLPFVDRVWYSTPDLAHTLRRLRTDSIYMPSPVQSAFFDVPYTMHDPPRILFAVPLSHVKGADLAIKAMHALAASGAGVKITSFAFGPDASEASELRAKIPTEVVTIPWTEHASMARLFAEFDVVVGQLRLGILSVTELEAMAAGRPVVAKWAQSLYRAEHYYARDPPVLSCETSEAVAKTVLDLVSNSTRLQDLSADGRSWVQDYHSAGVVARLYCDEYADLLRTHRVRHGSR